jgi:hypothetical protein
LEAKSTPLSIAYHKACGARFEHGESPDMRGFSSQGG